MIMLVRILFLSLLTSVTLATEIEIAEPEQKGLSSDRLKRVTQAEAAAAEVTFCLLYTSDAADE